ncbi:DUF4097 and DUF4098 domain-containing protein YvlB [Natronospira proteinivora]|uniref:DUF4097 and DUF4098 domain-containing protein YvlB n=1 Tax=Natronospira proteinivora TaxID=1807133 RepID=A0ABT1G649_9GAMM|nr:hypothetical protein [Natronospira proteinivora]MCP1726774.1 DUF4097 and DUF4098 domain-containing protein YvlB [Natronospira proteinivora]
MNVKAVGLIVVLFLAGCGNGVNQSVDIDPGSERHQDFRTVNGTITVGEAARVEGVLETVNGGIRVGPEAEIGRAETVNGSIRVEDGATTAHLTTVNGNIRIASNVVIDGNLKTVNGAIGLGQGSRLNGDLSNFNGGITIEGGHVAGNVSTRTGDIRIIDGARIEGDVHVQARSRGDVQRDVRVVIGREAVVEGTLRMDRRVQLLVHESAQVGDIQGAEAETFTGDEPRR